MYCSVACVELDGVDDGINGFLDRRFIGRIGKFQCDAVPTIHPGIGDEHFTLAFRPDILHIHSVVVFHAGLCFTAIEHLEQIRTGNFPEIGGVGLDGDPAVPPVKAEIRTVLPRFLHKMIREFHGEAARFAWLPVRQRGGKGENKRQHQKQSC